MNARGCVSFQPASPLHRLSCINHLLRFHKSLNVMHSSLFRQRLERRGQQRGWQRQRLRRRQQGQHNACANARSARTVLTHVHAACQCLCPAHGWLRKPQVAVPSHHLLPTLTNAPFSTGNGTSKAPTVGGVTGQQPAAEPRAGQAHERAAAQTRPQQEMLLHSGSAQVRQQCVLNVVGRCKGCLPFVLVKHAA